MSEAAVVRAWLAAPLAGDPPQLDSLLETLLSIHFQKGDPGYKVDRQFPAPAQGGIEIPLARAWLGPWLVALASAPILGPLVNETVHHVAKRIGVERASYLAPEERRVVTTTNSWTKSYRLPLRIRSVPWVAWIVRAATSAQRYALLKVLRRCRGLGKKIADGYGQVARWEVDSGVPEAWWFASHEQGPVLMRPLPLGEWLPEGLLGARQDFGACSPPYWHPDRYTEIVSPC